jgi:hypothetical protein
LGDLETLKRIGSEEVAKVAHKVNPRYHFVPAWQPPQSPTTGIYYERLPYVNTQEYPTRLIAIAKSSNDKKQKVISPPSFSFAVLHLSFQTSTSFSPYLFLPLLLLSLTVFFPLSFKWLYAAKVAPISQMDPATLGVIPPGATFDPYDPNLPAFDEQPPPSPQHQPLLPLADPTNKRKAPADGLLPTPPETKRVDRTEFSGAHGGFFFPDSAQGVPGGRGGRGGRGDGRGGRGGRGGRDGVPHKSQLQQPCWFCLGSDTVERHLVVSVADSIYLALPKGGLVDEHMLIIPIRHQPSIMTGLEATEKKELKCYKQALTRFFSNSSSTSSTTARVPVFFERNVVSPHGHVQVVPVPTTMAQGVISFFIQEGSKLGIEFQELPPIRKEEEKTGDDNEVGEVTQGRPYFYVEVEGRRLLHLIPPRAGGGWAPHPMQFGRQVMAKFLGMEERTDWKSCALSKDEETTLASTFKTHFTPLDFSLTL